MEEKDSKTRRNLVHGKQGFFLTFTNTLVYLREFDFIKNTQLIERNRHQLSISFDKPRKKKRFKNPIIKQKGQLHGNSIQPIDRIYIRIVSYLRNECHNESTNYCALISFTPLSSHQTIKNVNRRRKQLKQIFMACTQNVRPYITH